MRSTDNQVLVSAASAWEFAVKYRLGKISGGTKLAADFEACVVDEGFEALSITLAHAVRAGALPGPHKDPFDRILIAQAQAENLPIVSIDRVFDAYGVRRLW